MAVLSLGPELRRDKSCKATNRELSARGNNLPVYEGVLGLTRFKNTKVGVCSSLFYRYFILFHSYLYISFLYSKCQIFLILF